MPKVKPPYEVGYGKPPAGGKFAKGQSGNPKGRPKGSKNLATVVLRESRQTVRVNGPRGSRLVNKLEATVMQLGNKAAQGDIRAQRDFLAQVRMSEEAASSEALPLALHEMDHQVLQNILRRMRSVSAEAATANPESTREESK
jgi:Family of unknown function (DUF5681)